jgi:hypothetical protein
VHGVESVIAIALGKMELAGPLLQVPTVQSFFLLLVPLYVTWM